MAHRDDIQGLRALAVLLVAFGHAGVPFLSGGYVLESRDGSTEFIVTGDIEGHGFFKLGEPVFTRMAARELEANLGHLKDLLEAREEPPSG